MFADEIFPVDVVNRAGDRSIFAVDEHPRRETSMEKLASLKPLHPEIEGFSITAGNSGGVNDGAAAMVLARRELSERLGLEPLASVRAWASAGVPPAETGLAPTIAIPKALERAGLGIDEVDPLGDQRGVRLDVRGHHPHPGHRRFAGERARERLQPRSPDRHDRCPHGDLPVHEIRRRGGGTGVAAMCAGGGMSTALVLDVADPVVGQ